MSIETTIIVKAVVLWFAHGWYLNTRLERVHAKLDRVLECFDGLREYLYEIDSQFDDERHLLADQDESTEKGSVTFARANHMKLTKEKERAGKRITQHSVPRPSR